MSHISFALLQASDAGVAVREIADRLQLPEAWVAERIEAARLCLVAADSLAREPQPRTRHKAAANQLT